MASVALDRLVESRPTLRQALKVLRRELDGVDYLPGGRGPDVTLDDGTVLSVTLAESSDGGLLSGCWQATRLSRSGERVGRYEL